MARNAGTQEDAAKTEGRFERPKSAFLSRWVEDDDACLATVSRIEVPSFPRWHLLDEMRRTRLELLVGALPEFLHG